MPPDSRRLLSLPTCPHCGEHVDTRSVYWRVCAGCLARHHPGCWRSANGCARCRDSLALRHPLALSTEGELRLLRIALALALTILAGVSFHLGYRVLRQEKVMTVLQDQYDAEHERVRELSEELQRQREPDR